MAKKYRIKHKSEEKKSSWFVLNKWQKTDTTQ